MTVGEFPCIAQLGSLLAGTATARRLRKSGARTQRGAGVGAGALEGPGEEAQPVGTGPAAGRMSTVAEQHGGSGEGQSLRIPTELPSWTRPLTQGSNLPWVTDPP